LVTASGQSNVTEVQSKSFGLVTDSRHYNACPIYEYVLSG